MTRAPRGGRSCAARSFRSRPLLAARRLAGVAVDRLDEHRGRPRATRVVVAHVVVERRLRREHLLERLALRLEIADTVAHDHDHVPVIEELRLVAYATVARDHV